jgi:hypothetical protein
MVSSYKNLHYDKESNQYSNKTSKINKWIITLVCILVFLRPHFSFIPDVASVYWPDGLIILVLIIYLLKPKHENLVRISIGKSSVVLEMFFIILLLIPIALNQIINGFSFEGIFSYLKVIYYYLVFWAVYNLTIKTPNIFSYIEKIIYISFIVNFLVSTIQLLALPMLSDIIGLLYGTEKLRTIWSGYARVYGTLYNANWFGVYLIFNLAWFNGLILSKRIKPINYAINIILLAFMLVISGSRTAIFAAIITTTVQLLRYAKPTLLFKMLLMLVPILFIGINSIGRIEILSRTLNRFSSTFMLIISDGMKIENLAGSRWPEWILSYNIFIESPWIGNAPGHYIPHNSYLSLLIGFGILGTIILLILLILISRKFNYENTPRGQQPYFRKAFIGYLWGFAIASLAGDYWFSTQVMLILVILAALVSASSNKYSKGTHVPTKF